MSKLSTTGKLAFFAFVLVFFASCSGNEEVRKPTLYIVGDSTVKNGSGTGSDGLWGWGNFLGDLFDTTRITIENHAIGGRSSRSFLREGRWDTIMNRISANDFVLIQLGHNDGGPMASGRARASIKGTGNEWIDVIMESDSSHEIVHTYGWYIRKYVTDAQSVGAIPIVLSPVPRNRWDENGRVYRASYDYGLWAKQVAIEEDAFFVDLNELVSLEYEKLGEDTVRSALFLTDHTHTNMRGAKLNAEIVVKGISELEECGLKDFVKE